MMSIKKRRKAASKLVLMRSLHKTEECHRGKYVFFFKRVVFRVKSTNFLKWKSSGEFQ